LEVHNIPGNHLDMIKEPHVQVLAEKLRLCLNIAANGRTETEVENIYAEPESTHEQPIAQHSAWRDARDHRNDNSVALGELRAVV
jgi:hypothetical protein